MAAEQKTHTRTISKRTITYRCEWCSQEHTEERYPGPKPRYCENCKTEAQNALAAGRMRRHRAKEKSPTA